MQEGREAHQEEEEEAAVGPRSGLRKSALKVPKGLKGGERK